MDLLAKETIVWGFYSVVFALREPLSALDRGAVVPGVLLGLAVRITVLAAPVLPSHPSFSLLVENNY